MPKKKGQENYSEGFRKEAMARMQACGNIVALAKELGVSRRVLYQWREQGKHGGDEARPRKPRPPSSSPTVPSSSDASSP